MIIDEVTIDRIYLDVPRDFKGQYHSKFEILQDLLTTFERSGKYEDKYYKDIVIKHFKENERIYEKEQIYFNQITNYFKV